MKKDARRVPQIKEDFPVIFKDLLEKFPQFNPKWLINAVIKHRFLKYRDGAILPFSQMFYVGATALFEEWRESGESAVTSDEFFQKSFKKIAKEIYFFLKHECPEIRIGVLFVDSNEEDMDQFVDPSPKADDILSNKEVLGQFFLTTTPETKALFEHYLLGHGLEATADNFGISSHRDRKARSGVIQTKFRLSIKKARKIYGVTLKAPICLYERQSSTLDERREKTSLKLKKYREKLKRKKEEENRK